MIKVGLTGNMGSGKSTVARVFQISGIPVYHADHEAKKILDQPDVRDKLTEIFGKDMIDQKGQINRKKLASLVFNDQMMVNRINRIIHPLVEKDFKEWMDQYPDKEYIIQEAAILFESGFHKLFDKVIFVSAPKEIRINRIIERDHSSRQEILKRMQHQESEKKKITRSDFVVRNDGKQLIIPQILNIHQQLLA